MLRQGTSKADIWIYFYSQVRHFLLLLVTLRMVPECLPYDGDTNPVVRIAVTAGEIFSGYNNGDVVVRDEGDVPVSSGQAIMGAAIAPEDRLVAVGGGDGYIRLWNPLAGSQIRLLRAGTQVAALAFSPGGAALATAGPGQVTVWNPATGRPERALPLAYSHDVQVQQTGYSASGSFLAADVWPASETGPNAYIEVWDTRTWHPILIIPAPLAAPQAHQKEHTSEL